MKHRISKKKNAGTQDKIISYVRDCILTGEYHLGELLPPRTFFVKKFGTTLLTVQRAFDFLIANGFVVTKSRRGSFVADRPPNLFRYALVFARDYEYKGWTRFWQMMLENRRIIEEELYIDIEIYFGLEYGTRSSDYIRFINDIKAESLGGIIYSSELHNFPSETYVDVNLPQVCISRFETSENISRIVLDKQSFYKSSVEKLVKNGCQRVAVIAATDFLDQKEQNIVECFKENGLTYYSNYVQGFIVQELWWVRRFVSLLLSLPIEKRPDAFWVLDDNMLPEVLNGIHDEGLIAGKDIRVVSHTNFPVDVDLFPGVDFVGYDIPDVLRQGILELENNNQKKVIEVIAESL